MRVAFLSLGLLCLVGLAAGHGEVKGFFKFFFDFENKRQYERIVGGTTVTIARYPFALSLRRYSNHICSATVISANFAATSAHCTAPLKSLTGLTLYGGSTSLKTGGTSFPVASSIVHPNYNPETFDFDVAVLRVQTPFSSNPNIAPVQLIAADTKLADRTSLNVIGWGRTMTGESLSPALRATSIPAISNAVCSAIWSDTIITDNMLCAGTKGKDSCTGDSGGSLLLLSNNFFSLVGIVSWGSASCGSEYPGIYARVASPNIRSFLAQYT
ncbi:trypsin-3-like [Anopheles nili]|uniref:trypsin-3-like n=1 Tax=Anopheles nili TaxID=185578 RepID=UPI00237A31CB|nr:trypsin-3-like [Anopheles nili]